MYLDVTNKKINKFKTYFKFYIFLNIKLNSYIIHKSYFYLGLYLMHTKLATRIFPLSISNHIFIYSGCSYILPNYAHNFFFGLPFPSNFFILLFHLSLCDYHVIISSVNIPSSRINLFTQLIEYNFNIINTQIGLVLRKNFLANIQIFCTPICTHNKINIFNFNKINVII